MRWAATSVENRVCDGPLMWMRLEYLHGLWAVSWVTGRRPKAKGIEAATDAVDSEPGGKAGPVTEDEDCGAAGGIQREAGSACRGFSFPCVDFPWVPGSRWMATSSFQLLRTEFLVSSFSLSFSYPPHPVHQVIPPALPLKCTHSPATFHHLDSCHPVIWDLGHCSSLRASLTTSQPHHSSAPRRAWQHPSPAPGGAALHKLPLRRVPTSVEATPPHLLFPLFY